jgi:hypothetical protein
MRKIQKVIIIIYCILVAVACVYVPWRTDYTIVHYVSRLNNFDGWSLDYSLIWKRPSLKEIPLGTAYNYYTNELDKDELFIRNATIEFQKIILELIAITAVFAILFVLTLRPKVVRNEK